MTTFYVPRVLGSTLILTAGPPPTTPVATILIIANFRSGSNNAMFRDGNVMNEEHR